MNPNIKRTDFGCFVMVNDTHLSRWVEQDGRLDHARDYIAKFKHLIPEGGTVIDCGTSIGDHTVTYASYVGPNGKVFGFEANPDVAECCALNLAIYPWASIRNQGLSDDYGTAGIDINPNVGASRLTKEGRSVMLVPLDSILDELTRCDFIKVDIEGFEPKMLKGAEAIISKFHPAILMEVNQGALEAQGATPNSIYEILDQYGYAWRIADGKFGTPQYDILAFFAKRS
jgi:FkbM family methyltransferase